ncbi:MAG: bifunctional diaminohydroxyphosphoribosylaminopyrimidine deaminase/5-amino-6-(5-phosphoribosylamino)uracil reductase RibD [Candidatus Binatia bacterium]|jgi:diaminohydroxyphosphoribosylaminopyrimidine deaminase / 5-amino-6-(5-phosphoribosylamino)uracil reductase
MREALRLAERGAGRTSPNPAVGAVVARGGRWVGRGHHRRAGGPHAEVFALRQAGTRARGATLYVTLEPCCHFGRTPPCVDAVLASGVSRVVVGSLDPNPRVRGRGVTRLRRAGLRVDVGVLEEECRALNEDYAKHVTRGLPFVVMKLAATLDGRIAAASGDSRWVTGAAARRRVHEMRNRLDAVVVGSETVRIDDPELTCRLRGGRHPLRVILDGRLRCPHSARVFTRDPERTRLYTLADDGAKAERLRRRGVTVRRGGGDRAGSLRHVLRDLARDGIKSLLIEGGGVLAAHALRAGLVDRLAVFLAPKILGGDGRPVVAPMHIRRMADALSIVDVRLERLGADLLVQGRPTFRKTR